MMPSTDQVGARRDYAAPGPEEELAVNGPSEELRAQIASQLDQIASNQPNAPRNVTPETEERLTGVLGRITAELEADSVNEDDNPQTLLDATNEWAGLLSYAVSRVYAPASPWPFGLGGWGHGPVQSLRRAAVQLQNPLGRAAAALGADCFSVSVGFPWGVAVGLSWPIRPRPSSNRGVQHTRDIQLAGNHARNGGFLAGLKSIPGVEAQTRFVPEQDSEPSMIRVWSAALIPDDELRRLADATATEIRSVTDDTIQ
jgi:hypothetical protein